MGQYYRHHFCVICGGPNKMGGWGQMNYSHFVFHKFPLWKKNALPSLHLLVQSYQWNDQNNW